MSARARTAHSLQVQVRLSVVYFYALLEFCCWKQTAKGKTMKNIISAITKFSIKTVLVSFFFPSSFHFFLHICLSLVHQHCLCITFSLSHLHLRRRSGTLCAFVHTASYLHSISRCFRSFFFFAIHMRAKDACKSFA